MCVRARPLGDLRVVIATSQLCPKYFPFTYLFYQDCKVEMAKVCHITNKIFQDKDSLINVVNSTVLIVQYTIAVLYILQRLVYPWSLI